MSRVAALFALNTGYVPGYPRISLAELRRLAPTRSDGLTRSDCVPSVVADHPLGVILSGVVLSSSARS